jgi:hypothetical protein
MGMFDTFYVKEAKCTLGIITRVINAMSLTIYSLSKYDHVNMDSNLLADINRYSLTAGKGIKV